MVNYFALNLYNQYKEKKSISIAKKIVNAIQMNVKLEDIVNITTGLYKKGSPSGNTYYLQAKHFDQYGKFREDAIINPEIYIENRLTKHILQDKDLLITAKGENNRVCFYNNKIGHSVASSTFFVIRLKEPNIMPKYLQWYFNTSKMQGLLSTLSKGTHTLSLSKKSLSKVKVDIPPLKQQQEILKIQKLWDLERKTILKLLQQKELLYQNLQLNLTK